MQGLEAGQRFERYRVLRFLGTGISGESYEAEDMLLQRKVLLKLIHPWLMLSDAVRRQFFREMQYSSSITHPYLATILDYGEVDSQLYLVRGFVAPGSLLSSDGRVWFNPPLALADAIGYIYQLAQGLQHLHDHGLTHGSLTFSNIMVLGDPALYTENTLAPFLLTDIGTASFVRCCGFPKISFLPITAAPEQLEKQIVPASDQYALATLLYFWLAGRPPFLGTPDVLIQQKLTETMTPLTLLNQEVTAQQEETIHRALSSSPEKRYLSILAFAEDLVGSLLPSTFTPQISHEPLITHQLETPITPLRPTEQHTDELPPVEQEMSPVSPDDQDEAFTLQENNPSREGFPAFDPLLNSLLGDMSTASSYYDTPLDSESMLNTEEPAIRDELMTEPGPQGYLPPLSEDEADSVWSGVVFEEKKPVKPQPQIEPDIPQPFPLPEQTPEPQPEPEQQPIQKTQPEPVTPLPQPAPDIAQPLPEPSPIPPEKPAIPPRRPSAPDEQQTQNAQKMMPRLVITSHYLAEPREVPLEQEIITLGRAGSSDILLDYDNLTSRHHALLKYDRDQYVIFDQRSARGVSVNGQRLTCGVGWRLTDGDRITIGAYTLVFHASSPNDDIAAPNQATASP
jgi:serine/threonine protein kinase